MHISRVVYIENEDVNLDKDAPETGRSQSVCLRASLSVVGNWVSAVNKFDRMNNRVIRDIRHYEIKPTEYVGDFDGILGNVYKSSFEIKCIGQRIARKLNELKFMTGDFDHIYIYLTSKLDNGKIIERDFEYDNKVKCFDFGQNREEFNSMIDSDREKRISNITFRVLKWKFGQDNEGKSMLDTVQNQIEKEGRALVINYKDKETKDYKLNIGFQIAPIGTKSKIVITYLPKEENRKLRATVDLNHFEDIYYLVDKIFYDGQQIILEPKKSMRAELVSEKYSTPLIISISELEPID